MIYIWNKEIAV